MKIYKLINLTEKNIFSPNHNIRTKLKYKIKIFDYFLERYISNRLYKFDGKFGYKYFRYSTKSKMPMNRLNSRLKILKDDSYIKTP